jgi:hypothetical protein
VVSADAVAGLDVDARERQRLAVGFTVDSNDDEGTIARFEEGSNDHVDQHGLLVTVLRGRRRARLLAGRVVVRAGQPARPAQRVPWPVPLRVP